MRDLVIWEVALRIARRDGKAILLSRDVVHSHDRGADEARGSGLFRANTFDQALNLIGRESPSGSLARSVLQVAWAGLRDAGLPIPKDFGVHLISRQAFVVDAEGHASGSMDISVATTGGLLTGRATIRQLTPQRVQAELTEIRISDHLWESGTLDVNFDGELPLIGEPAEERLADLRTVIEEGE
jgi:hypothetical protein